MSYLDGLKLPDDIKELSYEDLERVAEDTRHRIIETCSKTGGHIAPSLGVVELTIALLKTFNPENDRIIWDVGHQSYAFKILTDRKDRFHTLRQYKGISGFNKPCESTFDAFGVGHTSTSISAGLGMRLADDILGRERRIVSVIGDGAMTAGMAFEALNNLGELDKNMIVVLNDNEMSISPNVGGFSNYLSNMMTSKFYTRVRKEVQSQLEDKPLGPRLLKIAKKMEEGMVGFFTPGILFEEIGLRYIGPIQGHKTKDIVKALENAKGLDGPVLVHVLTKKGKGYKPAEDNPSKFHGVASFDRETGESVKIAGQKSYTDIFGETLAEMADNNKCIVGISAAMKDGTGLNIFEEKHPDRVFDVGIAEQHAVTLASGMAISGLKPFVAIYSTFMQRAYDQIIHDVALQNLPVVLCLDRGGLVGADGPTHHGIFDISYLRCVPNLTVMLPKDGYELVSMLKIAEAMKSPAAIRYARGEAGNYPDIEQERVVIGEPQIVNSGEKIAIVSAGHIFCEAYKAYKKLKEEGFNPTLINLRFLKPLNEKRIADTLRNAKLVVTIEEGSVKGGAGEEIQSIVMDHEINAKVVKLGIPDKFIEHGDLQTLRKIAGITADVLVNQIKEHM
ncbi:MAG: 1-deoxy-D-xylulose-5-phosphate synthase [Denitrovibrio sp.]|nr:MAG: 1-deoxy-D-xylulose-5-phosphate synthase [Denitrovibrio sp.]